MAVPSIQNTSQKRTIDNQPSISTPKRKKIDAVNESMPLAAKGKPPFFV
jgi:hypothetical protein